MLIPWEDQLGIGEALTHPDIPSELVTRTRVHTRSVASNFARPYPLFSRTRIKGNISSSLLETVEHKHVTARQNEWVERDLALILTALQIGLRSDEHRRGARSRSGVGRRSSNRQAQGDDCGVAHRCLSQQSAAPGRAYRAGAWLLRRQRCVQRYGRMRWRQRHSKRLTTMKWSRKASLVVRR